MSDVAGLPVSTWILLVLAYLSPFVTYGLYRIDKKRNDGYISILGYRGDR